MSSQNKIKCPNCGTQIDVNEILSSQLESEIKRKFNSDLAVLKKEFENKENALLRDKEELENLKEKQNELIEDKVSKKLKLEKEKISSEIKAKLLEEQSEEIKLLQDELNEKSDKLKEYSKARAEIEKLKREKEELKESIEADAQKQLNEKLDEEKQKIRQNEHEKTELRIREYEKKLEDQKKLIEEMQRKHDQGSMQLQGEVQELAIEEWLSINFPFDEISEIKKGARGADCLQIVNTNAIQNCGSIYYESKRTKDFQKGWIEKFKADMREKDANIGVLVTDAMPNDMERMGQKDGVWICTFNEFKGLCFVLRESVIQINNALVSQENKGDKMSLLYDYLTSNTFRLQIEAIVEGFSQMKEDLESEKRAMQRIWKTREKQIEKVTVNTIDLYGAIKGIAGNAIQSIKSLELPE